MSDLINKYAIGKYVVVRTYSAGVHCGVLVARSGREALLEDTRRIWSWKGANTLHEISLRGVDAGASKLSDPIAQNLVTEAIEVLVCTAEGERNLRGAEWTQ